MGRTGPVTFSSHYPSSKKGRKEKFGSKLFIESTDPLPPTHYPYLRLERKLELVTLNKNYVNEKSKI